MTLRLAASVAIAACNAAAALADTGAGTSLLRIYSGAEPATAETALGAQVVLAEFQLPDPAFGAAVDTVNGGAATLNAVAPQNALATGTASFYRIIDGDGYPKFQGKVTDTTGDGDLKVSSTSLVQDIEVTIVSLVLVQPK